MAVFLVRHAHAGNRRGGLDDDHRALSRTGRQQAAAIAEHLGDRHITAIVASPAARCVETVAPLAEKLGLIVATSGYLYEGSEAEVVLGVIERSRNGGDLVVCSHGDVIPELIRTLTLEGLRVHGHRVCAKGSVWELTTNGDERWHEARYHPPSA